MPAAWPASLPLLPLIEGYQERPPANLISFQPLLGPPRVRLLADNAERRYQQTFSMSAAQALRLRDFYFDDLKGGSLTFEFADPRTGSPRELRFVPGERPRIVGRIGGRYRVACQFMTGSEPAEVFPVPAELQTGVVFGQLSGRFYLPVGTGSATAQFRGTLSGRFFLPRGNLTGVTAQTAGALSGSFFLPTGSLVARQVVVADISGSFFRPQGNMQATVLLDPPVASNWTDILILTGATSLSSTNITLPDGQKLWLRMGASDNETSGRGPYNTPTFNGVPMTEVEPQVTSPGSTDVTAGRWYYDNDSGADITGATLTITAANPTNSRGGCHMNIAGVEPGPPEAFATVAATGLPYEASVTTLGPNRLLIGGANYHNNTGLTPATGQTERSEVVEANMVQAVGEINAATAGVHTMGWTSSKDENCVVSLDAFAPAGGGGGGGGSGIRVATGDNTVFKTGDDTILTFE